MTNKLKITHYDNMVAKDTVITQGGYKTITISDKLSQAWDLLYDVRKERKAEYNQFNDDPISNILLHAMHDIREAHEDLQKELESKSI